MTRVAAYCRVSTDKTDQVHSFNSQKEYFVAYIKSRPDWSLTEIYADEGITGTTTADRAGFLRMIADAEKNRFDLILTKEVSRFSRNILDAIAYTRRLKERGVGVIFLNDGISTLDSDAELRLGIMASVAQEESRRTSERVRWGQMRKMERGVVFGRSLLGYDVNSGSITVEPAGAEIVRQIFRMYLLERMGVRAIAKALTEKNVSTKTGHTEWSGASVLKILKNEKYCGDLCQKKTITTDYLTHRKIANAPDNMIILRGHHAPIISREDWEAVQAELKRRSNFAHDSEKYRNRYALSGKCSCAGCGAKYLCRTRRRKDGASYRVWICQGCVCGNRKKQLREEVIAQCARHAVILSGIVDQLGDLSDIFARVLKDQDTGAKNCEKEIALLRRKKIKLIDMFLAGEIDVNEYLSLKAQYEDELSSRSVELRQNMPSDVDEKSGLLMLAAHALATGDDPDDTFYLSLVDRIEIRGNTGLDICLSGAGGKWMIEI